MKGNSQNCQVTGGDLTPGPPKNKMLISTVSYFILCVDVGNVQWVKSDKLKKLTSGLHCYSGVIMYVALISFNYEKVFVCDV
jgi:hypothetical protein